MTATHTDSRAWHDERARFNHDWLMVSFLTFIQAWGPELDRAGEGAMLPHDVEVDLRDWQQYRPRLDALLGGADSALGPAAHFEALGVPLSLDAQRYLLDGARALWRERSGIVNLLEAIRVDAAQVDTVVEQLLDRMPVDAAGIRLYETCLRISQNLSSLPSAEAQP